MSARSSTLAAARKQPDLRAIYSEPISSLLPGAVELELRLVSAKRDLDLTSLCETISWGDEGPVQNAALSLRRPAPERASSLPIALGAQFELAAKNGNAPEFAVWRMVAEEPGLDRMAGTVSIELSDPDVALSADRVWRFVKGRSKPLGWTAAQITEAVCAQEKVDVRALPSSTMRNTKLEGTMSGLEMIRKAWEAEGKSSDRRYVVRLRGGRLEVRLFERGKTLYRIGDEALREPAVTLERKKKPWTVLHAFGQIGKGKNAKKIKLTVQRPELFERLGQVEHDKDFGRVGSRADLEGRAKRSLARQVAVVSTATITVAGVPQLERGVGVRLELDEPTFMGADVDHRDRSFCWVTGARHQLQGGQYTTTISLTQQDPYLADMKRIEDDLKETAAARRDALEKKK